MNDETKTVDLAGIGLGPFNLSLAALADGIPDLSAAFFERSPTVSWHAGLTFSDAVLQTSPLKDLVTPVCPTNRWSFLNYLVENGRFYDFMAARFETVSRQEFSDYLAWAADGLSSTHLDAGVEDIDFTGNQFRLRFKDRPDCYSRALAIGTGREPLIPANVVTGPDCFHASQYLHMHPDIAGRRVAVIGGGQSGAEIVLHLLQQDDRMSPDSLSWISRRDGFWTLQEGGLVDQFFTPDYLESYRSMTPELQARALSSQKFASDGLTPSTADAIYRLLYQRRHLRNREDVFLYPGREVVQVQANGRGQTIVSRASNDRREALEADIVILATGYRAAVPGCLRRLAGRLAQEPDGALALGDNYRALWDGPSENPIYGLNHGRRSYGVIDPQLSMAAWRSAVILNDVTGRRAYGLGETERQPMVAWEPRAETLGWEPRMTGS
ncbi:lysine N(6)-hydroxylase/L-ornithine N(5)-oxygenase family protein [Notoacmeibacter sp. MSK16QG-6]|uniref:lysine N(6)-hydroxylase/L-ornithine N(5)-oxygenase family protein n=1 Tax=Notoacmeibacter sp. MSK16QG-6 TaxID=2957982 RepID=UPI00209E7BB3|nr:SidA/IucD/PvdA family monooxygenase [Notoacmeibacter sp. MSK16QG-6]MCP1198312.1 SidA/IucD/PvdA family monooxygenase [Notoacmeibacter sp. MSK16QG-6]